MANIQGNRVALEDVFFHIFPAQASIDLVQEPIGLMRDPYLVVVASAGEAWKKIDCAGYELLFLAGDNVQQMGGSPAYVRFGQQGPQELTGTDPSGGVPVLAGTKIRVPQGFKSAWFLPSADTNWRVIVTKLPCVETDYGPYGWSLPPSQILSVEQHLDDEVTNLFTGTPTSITDGVEIPSRAKKLRLRILAVNNIVGVRRLNAYIPGGPLQIWWLPSKAGVGGSPVWARHGLSDDWTTTALGEASADHDIDTYECAGLSRIYIEDTTGWSEAARPDDYAGYEVIFYG